MQITTMKLFHGAAAHLSEFSLLVEMVTQVCPAETDWMHLSPSWRQKLNVWIYNHPSCQDKMYAVEVSAEHRYDRICTFHKLLSISTKLVISHSHYMFTTWLAGNKAATPVTTVRVCALMFVSVNARCLWQQNRCFQRHLWTSPAVFVATKKAF